MIAQLESVRRWARILLVIQVLLRWLMVLLGSALVCGLIDFALRLPGWLRLLVGVVIAMATTVWVVESLARALRFAPALSVLAQRAERLFPQLAGVFATGLEFAIDRANYRQPRTTDVLTQASIDRAQP